MTQSASVHLWRRARIFLVVVTAAAINLGAVPRSEARPLYKTVWQEVYSDVAKSNKIDCSVCHAGKDKGSGSLNAYCRALEKELGEKNCRDREKIAAAINAIAKKKCKCGNWDDRIQQGKLPCENCKESSESVIDRLLKQPTDALSEAKKSKTGS